MDVDDFLGKYKVRRRGSVIYEFDDVTFREQPTGPPAVERYRRFIEQGQMTRSRKNPRWFLPLYRASHPLADIGGEFYSSRTEYSDNLSMVSVSNPNGSWDRTYNGFIWPKVYPISNAHGDGWSLDDKYANEALISDQELRIAGTYAINKTIPTHPAANLSTFVGELRQGLPTIIGAKLLREKVAFYKSLGSEYLNVEFGWKPFLRDLQQLGAAHQSMGAMIKQLERDSGRAIRRSYTFPIVEPTVSRTIEKAYAYPFHSWVYNGGIPAGGGWNYMHERVGESRTWFTGRYLYHFSVSNSQLNRFHQDLVRWNKIYGVAVTPEVLWNLAPWSWLADWFANLGLIASNASAFLQDGLILNRAYIMCHRTVTDTHMMTGVRPYRQQSRDLVLQMKKETKVRDQASPYGFGSDFDGFTPRQIAILTALGLSRS